MKLEVLLKNHLRFFVGVSDEKNARTVASRIIQEGLWVAEDEGTPKGIEMFYPVHQILSVKLVTKK